MASRIMHYAIAHIIADSIEIKDKEKFILGNLEPDLCTKVDGGYMYAHFGGENSQHQTKGINWVSFADRYNHSILIDDEILGYFVHLITDACWLKHIREKHIRKYCTEKKKELTLKGYAEMFRYNQLFISKYSLQNSIHSIEHLAVSEANLNYKDQLISGLISDFTQSETSDLPFEIYPYEDVMAFIDLSVQKSITEINALRTNSPLSDPEEFYVPK